MKKSFVTTFVLLFLSGVLAFGQNTTRRKKLENPFENNGNLDLRFDYLYKTSTNYLDYKVISKKGFLELQKNTKDSIASLHANILVKKASIDSLENEISQLNTVLEKTKSSLQTSNEIKDSITIFGINIYKSNYNLIVLLVIASLLIVAGFFIFKFNNSNSVTLEAKKLLEDTQHEFEIYQKKSLERQQVLNRKLQDEILKNQKD